MTKGSSTNQWDMFETYKQKIQPLVGQSPWVLRITEYKDTPVPVFLVKERTLTEHSADKNSNAPKKKLLKDRGLLYGQSLRRCLPIIRLVISGVCDDAGIPLNLQRFIASDRIIFRGNLPLHEEAGTKLALMFKLQERIKDMDRVELIAWRVERFSAEEAAYWLSRVIHFGDAANRWARAGMRTMLGGQPGDKAVPAMLEKLRR
ncbi:hypothetical protein SPSYN_01275 [Sporotomaculum syntrophicum]|uniref:DUF7680 domain-containing protein n=1 Tax=Sporotomaculum syntrophicum TaxID=182264 RepID=A0A9D3AYT3_9FIRM|nr:hypothetical protein [Sporotomaculum syntrophicum]KAF1085139.1 hypothetical protein SPSYN_01275 [Sporotomaculum syntrophicum]